MLKGYKQVPGVNVEEPFLPFATDSTMQILLCMYLFFSPFCLDSIDIEVASWRVKWIKKTNVY
jgi:hypothetical protein